MALRIKPNAWLTRGDQGGSYEVLVKVVSESPKEGTARVAHLGGTEVTVASSKVRRPRTD